MPATETSTRLAAFARLRQQLDARSLGGAARPADEAAGLATGLPGVDEPLGGGLPQGALTELVFAAPSSGGQLFLLHLLHAARKAHRFLALVDGADSFDPQTIEPPALLRQLLWVRCAGAAQAMQAADFIARDSNFALLALDLRGCGTHELRRTPSTAWYRLQRIVEPTDSVLAVLTPRRLVPAAAQARLVFDRSLPLNALAMEQADIAEQLTPSIDRLRGDASWTEASPAPTHSLTLTPTRVPVRCAPGLLFSPAGGGIVEVSSLRSSVVVAPLLGTRPGPSFVPERTRADENADANATPERIAAVG